MIKTGGEKIDSTLLSQPKRCVHFYACICAFASDPKLSEEFSYYINLDQTQLSIDKSLEIIPQTEEEDKIVGIGKIICIYYTFKNLFYVPIFMINFNFND